MDNLTHTLIGALIGETAAHTTRTSASGLSADLRRTLLVGCGAIGSNLPDSDLLFSYFGPKVSYLLHHRGHTHTIVGALLLAGLAYGLIVWWLHRRRIDSTPSDRAWIAATLGGTALLHIAMDFMNNYGVHPFWPFDTRWRYGDSIFIIEPLLWVATAPLILLFKARWARALAFVLPAMGLAFLFTVGVMPLAVMLLVLALAVTMLLITRRVRAQVALASGIAVWLGVTGLFAMSSSIAAQRIERTAQRQFPQSSLVDHALSPMPANPLCWEAILVERERDQLTLRRAMLALAPALMPADKCGRSRFTLRTTASLTAVQTADEPALQWFGETRTPIEALAQLQARDCTANAALRFIRVPYLVEREGRPVLGDLRYDREPELGFSEVELGGGACPTPVPDWRPPRADVLSTPAPAPSPDRS